MMKGISYFLYKIIPPIDEQKIYDLIKTKNYEMKNK